MNLGVSIANLLRRYPAVGVPGIGVFRKTHGTAMYNAEKSVFLPPVDRIELVDDDVDVLPITTYLEAQQRLDESAATAMLEGAVRDIMGAIRRNGEVLLDGLGYLFADGASVGFKPFEFGEFVAKPIAARSPVVSTPDELAAPSDDEVDVSMKPEEELAVPDEITGQRRYKAWIVGGAVAAVLIATVAIWQFQPTWFGINAVEPTAAANTLAGSSSSSSDATPLDDANQGDVTVSDTSLLAAAVDTMPEDSVPVAGVPSAKPSVTFEIIVGSFATMRQADKFVTEMKAKGYDLYAIDSRMPGNRKKISWGSFTTEEEAYKELARVQKTFEPGAWIAKITHE